MKFKSIDEYYSEFVKTKNGNFYNFLERKKQMAKRRKNHELVFYIENMQNDINNQKFFAEEEIFEKRNKKNDNNETSFFIKIFLICYVITSIIYIYFFGNLNFFGEQGFHLDMYDLIMILTTWSLITSLIFSVIIMLIYFAISKLKANINQHL